MSIGEKLERLLEERELTQRQLAKDLHIQPSTLNGYIRGKRSPDCDTLIRIAEYFDVSTDYLLGVAGYRQELLEAGDVRESDLVGIYRRMQPENQDLLIEQAHFYYKMDLKKRQNKEK